MVATERTAPECDDPLVALEEPIEEVAADQAGGPDESRGVESHWKRRIPDDADSIAGPRHRDGMGCAMTTAKTTEEDALRRRLTEILAAEQPFVELLAAVREEHLPESWVAAGALRNLVWDRLHGFAHRHPPGDVDVVYYDPTNATPERDEGIERSLARRVPGLPWEVVNQAWIHAYNDEEPYTSTRDSLSRWTETCTSVAARLGAAGEIEILAPHGVSDLVAMVVRPNLVFSNAAEVFAERMASKRWPERWPRVRVLGLDAALGTREG
jgi:hypothetical protein